MLAKFNQCGICGVLNDWFKSYLYNDNQYVSIKGYESGPAALNCDVPQGTVLGCLLFLLNTNGSSLQSFVHQYYMLLLSFVYFEPAFFIA